MKTTISILLLGWFFTVTTPIHDYPGANDVAKEGPFKSELDCNAFRDELKAVLSMMGLVAHFTACVDEREV